MKKILSKIFLIFTILITTTLITLLFLGSIERKGYLEVTVNNDTTNYKVKMNYYDNIFRHSDLFSVYPITNTLPDYIETIKFDSSGSPSGYITTSEGIKVDEKIDNVYYTVIVKKDIFIYLFLYYLIYLISQYRIINYITSAINYLTSKINYLASKLDNNKVFKTICIFILVFSLFIRVYYALQDEDYHADEYASIWFSNISISAWTKDSYTKMNDKLEYDTPYLGKEIKKKYHYNDASIKDALSDIVSLYKNTNDPQISNVYYTLLRLVFTGREASDITNIILTGTILNSLFYIISFYFLIKLLKLLFKNNNVIILFTLLCISLLPSSISFTMFLRPYQMQESFFIIFIYLVLNTILNKKYSRKNFVILSIITGIGYLILTSSIIFVLCVSLVIYFYYIYDNYAYIKNKTIHQKTIEDKNLIYFASSFFVAFIVSFIIYPNFLGMLSKNTGRLEDFGGIQTPNIPALLVYLNSYLFVGSANIIIFALILATNIKSINIKKYVPALFLTISGILFYIISSATWPWPDPRYVVAIYPILFLIVPIFLLCVDSKKIRHIFIIIISIAYIAGSFNKDNLLYLYKDHINTSKIPYIDSHKKIFTDSYIFNKQPNLDVYAVEYLLETRDNINLNDNQRYFIVKDYPSLKTSIDKNNVSNFYLVTRNDYISDYNILKNELDDYNIIETISFSGNYKGNFTITELKKK